MGELLTPVDAKERRNRSTTERSRRWQWLDGLVHGRAADIGGCKGEEE
jgi:hypothetical protein